VDGQLRLDLTPASQHPGGVASLGLAAGDTVRFRRRAGGQWVLATVESRHRDGSVALRDEDGRARFIPPERVEVRRAGPRGGTRWEPVREVPPD
jgi:hypothetical protein